MSTHTRAPQRTPQPSTPAAANLDALEAVLKSLVDEHRALLELAGEHRRALTEADAPAIKRVLEQQGEVFHRIARLEMNRRTLVGSMTGNANGTPTISILAARAPEAIRSRLASVAKALREVLDALQKEHRALREAAETLSAHMEGLMRQVYRSLSHAGTYARSGAVDTSVQVVSTLDLKS
jgi:hypothetical protein